MKVVCKVTTSIYRKSVASGRMYRDGPTVIHWLNFVYRDKWHKVFKNEASEI